MSCFCSTGISSIGISTPRSPRATIMPSETRMMSSMFSTPSVFSIFAMMRMSRQLFFSSSLRIITISSAERVNEAAINSKSSFTQNSRSARSFSLIYGMESVTPGTLMPL